MKAAWQSAQIGRKQEEARGQREEPRAWKAYSESSSSASRRNQSAIPPRSPGLSKEIVVVPRTGDLEKTPFLSTTENWERQFLFWFVNLPPTLRLCWGSLSKSISKSNSSLYLQFHMIGRDLRTIIHTWGQRSPLPPPSSSSSSCRASSRPSPTTVIQCCSLSPKPENSLEDLGDQAGHRLANPQPHGRRL